MFLDFPYFTSHFPRKMRFPLVSEVEVGASPGGGAEAPSQPPGGGAGRGGGRSPAPPCSAEAAPRGSRPAGRAQRPSQGRHSVKDTLLSQYDKNCELKRSLPNSTVYEMTT